MSIAGDLNTHVRRPGIPGSNGQLLLNNSGVEGASPNLTFNMGTSTLTVAGKAKVYSTIVANSSALSNNVTQVYTGLAAYKGAVSTAVNNTLTADANLILTFNETGHYQFETRLFAFAANSNTQASFNCDLGSNTAVTQNLVAVAMTSQSTGLGVTSNTANVSVGFSAGTSATTPSWVFISGHFYVTTPGNIGIRWAQLSTIAANATSLMNGSHFNAVKIG
jgi:hypothetical protein